MGWLMLYVIVLLVLAIVAKRNVSKLKGYVGERRVVRKLRWLGKHYTSYHDVYVPKANGELTQVDHIVTSPFGIFVIETKNYRGMIFGSEHDKYWTQMLGSHKFSFYSPIFQNRAHVNAVKYAVKRNVPIHSVIVFSNEATLKLPTFEQATVISLKHVRKQLKQYDEPLIASQELTAINEALQQLMSQTMFEKWKKKRRHLKQLKRARVRSR